MSTLVKCPRCGNENFPGLRFCSKCDARLDGELRPLPDWVPNASRTGVERTQTGLLLVIVALVLGPVPYLMYLGFITGIIGAVMVILGRNHFTVRHSYFVKISVGLYFLGFAIIFVAALIFGFVLIQVFLGVGSRGMNVQSVIELFNGLLITGVISAVVVGIAYVLFTYALQDSSGRLLLYVSFAAYLATSVLTSYIVSSQVASAASQSFATGTFDPSPITALRSQLQYLGLLGLIPAGLFSVSYYRVYSRIRKRELPQPTTQLGPGT